MKVFWDTSAAINALVSPRVWDRLKSGEHFARLHLFAEFFATMTGRGIPVKDPAGNFGRLVLTPSDAAQWLREFAAKVNIVELTPAETLDAIERPAPAGSHFLNRRQGRERCDGAAAFSRIGCTLDLRGHLSANGLASGHAVRVDGIY